MKQNKQKKFFELQEHAHPSDVLYLRGIMYFLTFWHKPQNLLNITQLKKNFEYQFNSEIVQPDTKE